MADKIIIAELGLDTQAFINAATKTSKKIDELIIANKKLVESGKKNSQEFVKNTVELKKNRAQLLQQQKAIIALESPYTKLSNQLIRVRAKAKDLAVEFGVNSRQARSAATEVRKLDTRLKRIDKSLGQSQRNVGNYGKSIGNLALRFIGLTTIVFGAIRAFRNMFNRVRTFDKAMVNLSAILGESRDDLKGLEEVIKDVAGASIKTSNEVAELATTLIVLGKTKEEVISLLKPVNDLSIALEATSQEAGELLVQTLNAFGKGSEEATRFADIIAKMRTSTALDFERIKDALGFLAPTARAAGVSFENTGAILGVLVDNGIKAARAGRLISTSFLRLAKDGKTLEDALDEINFAQERGVETTELLKVAGDLFGARSAALGLILADNRDKVARLTEEFENSKGTLESLTNIQLQSLDARLKILDSTWEKFILNVENGNGVISGFFKGLVDGAALAIQALDDINTVGFFEGLGTLFAPGGGANLLSVNAVIEKIRLKQIRLRTELLDLTQKNRDANETEIETIQELGRINTLNNKQLQEEIDLIKEKSVVETEASKVTGVISEEQKKANEQKKADAKKQREQEIADLKKFEQEKINVENEIEIAKAETDREKQELKAEQKLEKDLLDLENLQITEENKNELEILLRQAHQLRLDEIADVAREKQEKTDEVTEQKKQRLLARFARAELKAATSLEKAKAAVANAGLNVLKGILGDSLVARILDIALQGKTDIARVKITTAASQVRNLAQATAALPPPLNLPLIAAAQTQNIGLGVTSKLAQGKILLASIINAAGAAFYEGGVIGGQSNIPVSMRNKGGDDVLIQAKRGEVILNREQQSKAGGSAFFKSIGVPSFVNGGQVSVGATTTVSQAQAVNFEELGDIISEKINDVKIVAIESEITDAQFTQVEIVEGAIV